MKNLSKDTGIDTVLRYHQSLISSSEKDKVNAFLDGKYILKITKQEETDRNDHR